MRPSTGQPILDSDVLLYVPFTDANASTTADGYVLSGGTHTLTADVFTREGNAVINADQSTINGATTSAYGPAGTDNDGWVLDSTISSGLEVGSSSPLSIQFWFYCSNAASGGYARLLSWGGYHVSGTGFEVESANTDYDRFIFYEFAGAGVSRRSLGTYQLTANAWNHIYWAFQPNSGSYVGINGTVTNIANSYINNFAPTNDLNLLKTPSAADDAVKGYVQEFIVKDTVPYTANFTPTTVPLISPTSPSGTNPGTTNLVNDWSMDETSGTRADSHGSADLTDNNTVGYATGVISNAASFTAANSESLSSPTQPVTGTGARAAELWFKTSSTADMAITSYGSSGSGAWWRIRIENGVILQRVFSGTMSWSNTWNDGNWHHLVMQVAASSTLNDVDLYIDGTLQTRSGSNNRAINTGSGDFYIGAESTGDFFDGDIDEVRYWDRVLTANEITWLYNSGNGRAYSALSGGTDYRSTVLADNPLFYYRLGETSGTTAYDEVATANNGTYYNTPTLGQTGAISGDTNTSVLFEQANDEYAEALTLSSETSLLPCTIECFIKVSGASDDNAGIFFYRSGSNSASGLNIRGTTLGKLGYHWRGVSNTYGYAGGPTLSDNTWYYVALVVESTKATFYVIEEDGTLTTAVNTVSHSALDCSGDGWHIASDPFGNRYFQGYLDEVAIYDQALSQSTVVAHAAAAGYSS